MGLRDRMYELTTPEEVGEFLNRFPTGAIFKAGSCHKTMEGFGVVEAALDPLAEIHMGFIRVVENRPASNHVAELTGIVHESPQFILFVEGKAVFDLDNWEIQPAVMKGALDQHLPDAERVGVSGAGRTDLTNYSSLLEKFVAGKMPEEEFEAAWLDTFRNDATPRTQEEVELLGSLYGDADAPTIGSGVRERAAQLLEMVKG